MRPILLVHGAWGGAWAWGFIQAELEKHGAASHAVDLPSRASTDSTLADDAAAVRAALEQFDEPAVLVGHSYSGMVITDASAGNDRVGHLVYLCAALPQDGDSVGTLMASDPNPSSIGDAINMADDGTSTLHHGPAQEVLFNDATDEQFGMVAGALGSHRMSTFGEAASGLGWQEHPSTYILTTQDKVFSPDLQRKMAASANRVVEVDAGHIPGLTKPAEVAAVLVEAAQA